MGEGGWNGPAQGVVAPWGGEDLPCRHPPGGEAGAWTPWGPGEVESGWAPERIPHGDVTQDT